LQLLYLAANYPDVSTAYWAQENGAICKQSKCKQRRAVDASDVIFPEKYFSGNFPENFQAPEKYDIMLTIKLQFLKCDIDQF